MLKAQPDFLGKIRNSQAIGQIAEIMGIQTLNADRFNLVAITSAAAVAVAVADLPSVGPAVALLGFAFVVVVEAADTT